MREAVLQSLVMDAGRHVPMYRRFWSTAGIDVDGARGAPDFGSLPRLDKSMLRNCRPEERLHERRRGRRLTEERSSGSSGEPLTVFKDRGQELARRWAFLRALLACGYRPGQRCLFVTSRRSGAWPAATGWRYARVGDDTGELLALIDRQRPHVLYGPLSTLELLAARRPSASVGAGWPTLLVSTAEQLTRGRRAALERAFGPRIADFYGMTEFGLVAYRAPGRATFERARTSLLLEFLPVAGEPEVERLVVTDVAARTAPLIRYDTADLVRRDHNLASGPILEFAGRSFDCLVTASGVRVSPYRIDVVLEQITALEGFEVVQHPDRSVDVTLEVQSGARDAVLAVARQGLASVLGNGIALRVTCGTIRRGPHGSKFRPIRSLAGGAA